MQASPLKEPIEDDVLIKDLEEPIKTIKIPEFVYRPPFVLPVEPEEKFEFVYEVVNP